ncbi:hypothetical protein CLIM01_11847 [Colletotrichum limetticola]|uniref:Cytochrome P450 n=1 Tax=Colletotrichum limetticola TaxID=1209924 RepID=A0ABQ9PI06_9PEZI|nr:hypothetical protein CLIM01_11847 [Colletotrichum limetticola]
MMLILPALLVAVILLARWYSKPRMIPAYKGEGFFSFLSDAHDYAVKPISLIRRAQSQCGNIFSIQILTVHNVWLRGNELNKAYLDMPEKAWSFGHGMGIFLNKILDPGYMDNIRVMVGSLSRYINRATAQAHMAKCTVEETHRCALEWTTKTGVELFDGVSELTHKVIVRTLMGDDFYKSSEELLGLLHVMESDIGSIWSFVLPDWVPHPPARRLHHARERVKEIFWEKLSQRHVAAKNGDLETDLPDYITHTLHEQSMAPLRHFLPSHHTVLMFAAHTSTVAAISWVVVCLLRHPDVMAAVKRDARNGNTDSALLQACIKETMRYYAGMKCLRLAMQEVPVPGTDIIVPKGSVVSISPYLTHHDPANYPNPDTWMPGRWLNAENKLVNLEEKDGNSVKSMLFGGGSHRCPGEKMAMIIVTQTLTTLLRSYDVTWASPDQPRTVDFEDLDFDKVGSPWLKGDLKVKVSRRKWPDIMAGC